MPVLAWILRAVPVLMGLVASTASVPRALAPQEPAEPVVSQESAHQDGTPQEANASLVPAQDPRSWLPANESLTLKVEVTLGPVRGLDVGNVTLTSVQLPDAPAPSDGDAPGAEDDSRHLIGTIDTLAKGGYMGHEVIHSIRVRWYVGTHPRIEIEENLRGSRSTSRQMRIGEIGGKWQLEYRKDHHCKGCDDPAHFVEGFFPWSKPHHCEKCQRLEHRVWKPYEYLEVPPDTIDMVSALYYARGFLASDQQETSLSLVNQGELWKVRLRRGGTRKIHTPAGTFECMRVLIGPELAAGEGLSGEAAERFEALFGLHGDIGVWVATEGGFPVMIEGSAPFGPFDVAVKASLVSRR